MYVTLLSRVKSLSLLKVFVHTIPVSRLKLQEIHVHKQLVTGLNRVHCHCTHSESVVREVGHDEDHVVSVPYTCQ